MAENRMLEAIVVLDDIKEVDNLASFFLLEMIYDRVEGGFEKTSGDKAEVIDKRWFFYLSS